MSRSKTSYLLTFCLWASPAIAATDTEKQASLRKGLDYLYKTQQADGAWNYPGYEHGATGAALFAFVSQQGKWTGEGPSYQAAANKAISYLLSEAHITNVGIRDDGVNICPDGEASCKSITWSDSGDAINTTGLVAPAIAAYGLKMGAGSVATNSGPLAGMTWAQIAQGITNGFASTQSTGAPGRVGGAWRYATPGSRRPDRWTTQPAILSLLFDQALGAVTPQVVKNGLQGWLGSVEDASGAICYQESSSTGCELVGAGEWLLALAFTNSDVSEARVKAVLAKLNLTWQSKASNVWHGNFGHPYAMWTIYAGLESTIGLNDSGHISNFLTDCGAAASEGPTGLPGSMACTWAEDYNQWLVKSQKQDGSWAGYSYWTSAMATALHINILGAVEIPRATYQCPLRQAFWQNPRVAWPVDSLRIGGQDYNKSELLAILGAAIEPGSSGDASLVLVDELIAAKLNLAHGSEKNRIVDDIAAAETLLNGFKDRLPYHVDPSTSIGQKMVEQANLLDRYNGGAMTPGCISNKGNRNRQQPDHQAPQPATPIASEGSSGSALASIGNAQRAHASASSSKVRPFAKKGASSITLSPDGNSLATASTDNTIRTFVPTTGQQLLALPITLPSGVTFSPDGATLDGVGKDSRVHVWDAISGKELVSFAGHESPLRAVAASPNSHWIASAGEETRIMLWDAITRKLGNILYGSTDFLNALSFSPDSTLLASAGEDARVLLFDVAAGKVRYTLLGHSGPVNAVSFSRTGGALASGGQDSVIHVWDVVNGVQRQALAGHEAPIRALAFSPNGQLLASGGEDSTIILWDTASGKISKTLPGSVGAVNALIFDPISQFLISATDTGEISIWNLAAGIRLFTFHIPI